MILEEFTVYKPRKRRMDAWAKIRIKTLVIFINNSASL
jgi:hypothetical protein